MLGKVTVKSPNRLLLSFVIEACLIVLGRLDCANRRTSCFDSSPESQETTDEPMDEDNEK